MNPWMKFIAAVLLFGAWLALVLLHFVPAQSLVDAIGYTLAGLGVYHATAGSVGPIVTGTAALVSAELERPAAQPATESAAVSAAAVPAVPIPQAAPAPTIQ